MRVPAVLLLLIAVTLAGCTSGSGDSDGDGLDDVAERQGWWVYVETLTAAEERQVFSNPHRADTDGDGVDDVFEFVLSLDPTSPDTDGDGLSDCQEVRHTVRSECEDAAWDGEGDGGYGTDASLADSDGSSSRYVNANPDIFGFRRTNAAGLIARGDGIPDGDEVLGYEITLPGGGTRAVTTDPLLVDSDGDFLEDGYEAFVFRTDPTVKDTDGDGCADGLDTHPTMVQGYELGLESFTWTTEGESGAIEIAVYASIVDQQLTYPEIDPLTVQHGEPVDLSGAFGPVSTRQCTYQPTDPWVRIDLQVGQWSGDDYVRGLDVHSDTVPGSAFSMWWNVHDDRLAWNSKNRPGAPAREGLPITWSGVDGNVVIHPRVVDLQQE